MGYTTELDTLDERAHAIECQARTDFLRESRKEIARGQKWRIVVNLAFVIVMLPLWRPALHSNVAAWIAYAAFVAVLVAHAAASIGLTVARATDVRCANDELNPVRIVRARYALDNRFTATEIANAALTGIFFAFTARITWAVICAVLVFVFAFFAHEKSVAIADLDEQLSDASPAEPNRCQETV